jgi:alpha-glucosidase/alpha-D-xyloside xylohydrolase
MPYLYSVVREGCQTGLPIMRALWLHHHDDATAVSRGDEYLWGRDILVAPVTEKGATSRNVYLPRGEWFDFWTEERVVGGREVIKNVDLSIMPLYVRAGALIPLGPTKQYTEEKVDGPLRLQIYPGADGEFEVYEDDGKTFDFRRGAWMGIRFQWNDKAKRLSVKLARGSRMLGSSREISIRLVPGKDTKSIVFRGRAVNVRF